MTEFTKLEETNLKTWYLHLLETPYLEVKSTVNKFFSVENNGTVYKIFPLSIN